MNEAMIENKMWGIVDIILWEMMEKPPAGLEPDIVLYR